MIDEAQKLYLYRQPEELGSTPGLAVLSIMPLEI
jgi:hypothetical protein